MSIGIHMIKTIMSKSMLFTDESPLIYPDADLFGSIVGEIVTPSTPHI